MITKAANDVRANVSTLSGQFTWSQDHKGTPLARIIEPSFTDWSCWCRVEKIPTQLCGSPHALARSSSAGKKVALVLQSKTTHLIRHQVPPPAITQGGEPFSKSIGKPSAPRRARNHLAIDSVFKTHEQ